MLAMKNNTRPISKYKTTNTYQEIGIKKRIVV